MPKFFYIARDKLGRKDSGAQEGSSQEEVIRKLQEKGLFVTSILSEQKIDASGAEQGLFSGMKFRPKHSRVSNDDLVLYCRQLATLLGAGVTILKSLDIIAQQVSSLRLYQVIRGLQKDMEAGLSFHEAMVKHPRVFSELWVNLVESGEASGNLTIVLDRLAKYLERNAQFKRRVISALIYPSILLLAGTGALLFLTIRIIPTFAELFKGFNIKLPLLTQLLVALSEFLRKYFFLGIGLAVTVFFFFKGYIKTKEGRRSYENFKFKLPIFGEFFRALIVERFSSEMSTLIESGVPILYSLEIAEQSVGNSIVSGVIRQVKESVRDGKSLTVPLEKSGFFEPMVVQMVNIGEEIGELSTMFKKINNFYQEYVETFLTRFTAMFEPIMLLFMGVVIAAMVIGMFLPIFQIAQIGGG